MIYSKQSQNHFLQKNLDDYKENKKINIRAVGGEWFIENMYTKITLLIEENLTKGSKPKNTNSRKR